MIRVQTIFPRPQFNNFSRDTVPLNGVILEFPNSTKCANNFLYINMIEEHLYPLYFRHFLSLILHNKKIQKLLEFEILLLKKTSPCKSGLKPM